MEELSDKVNDSPAHHDCADCAVKGGLTGLVGAVLACGAYGIYDGLCKGMPLKNAIAQGVVYSLVFSRPAMMFGGAGGAGVATLGYAATHHGHLTV